MKIRRLSIKATVTTALVCAAALIPLIPLAPVVAQSHPTMTNVVPDGGEFAAQGKIQALDEGASTLTLVPEFKSTDPDDRGSWRRSYQRFGWRCCQRPLYALGNLRRGGP